MVKISIFKQMKKLRTIKNRYFRSYFSDKNKNKVLKSKWRSVPLDKDKAKHVSHTIFLQQYKVLWLKICAKHHVKLLLILAVFSSPSILRSAHKFRNQSEH